MRQVSLAAAAVLAVLGLGSSGCQAQPASDKAFDEKVHAYLLAHPEVIEEAIESLQARQEAQKADAAKTLIAQNRQALDHDRRDGVAGNPKGAVTLVEFFDYRCPFCKAAQPEIMRLLADRPNVRLVLKEFPILDLEDQTHISEDAARAALAAKAQGKYLKVHDDLLAQRQLDEAGIQRVLKVDGVDIAAGQSMAKSDAVSAQIADTHKLARAIGIDGTPAFIVNGTLIAGAQMDQIEAALDAARGARAR